MQRTFAVPLPLVTWLRDRPGTLSENTRASLRIGIELEKQDNPVVPPPTGGRWDTRKRINVRLSPDVYHLIEARRQEHKKTWTAVAASYLYLHYLLDRNLLAGTPATRFKKFLPEPLVTWLKERGDGQRCAFSPPSRE